MTINLSKGGNISLAKVSPGLSHAVIGLGWNPRSTDGAPFDLDASAILVDANGKGLSEANFVFYNNLKDPSGSVVHQGDNRTGDGEGDDETLAVDLANVPPAADRIVFLASINDADERRQTFGQVSDAYIRVYDGDAPGDSEKEARFDLGEDASTETALVFGELYRRDTEWKFRAIGQGYTNGLIGVLAEYGLNAG
ncbi:tellurium resistance protein TerD [Sediminihabitans luteus]|uniref:Tellurium resistance protein TerD n=1 Tax=Sediminihabitans luteus TaxID=1138585 RepID=A0A2M9CC09_9CELL|nr:TerD family protein [Sediminihabitans luteus]PJJ68587.1 tellurium resistance protein TerD [Sediminihabitans luteus]GII99925.1 chemical-damaging agent resistance protein C [Sediminihabitans luteus]